MHIQHKTIQSPLGLIRISGTTDFISEVKFCAPSEVEYESKNELLLACKIQLDEYFNGTRQTFQLPLQASGTVFQHKVWTLLQQIPFGQLSTYGQLAQLLNMNNGSSRAVGLANGKNPIAIIIPCHRVIGQNGNLTGYAGGVWRKQWLLEHERKNSHVNGELF